MIRRPRSSPLFPYTTLFRSGLNHDSLKPAYTDPTVWDNFDPGSITLCSPDPQAIRPPDEKVNVLMVTLPTNLDRKSTRLNSSHSQISYAVFCLKKKTGNCTR